uniref:Uncharacterized protein n=1 Tax=Rhizophora mucronata TaxID=61149 RepID=A0A2P2QZV1_RHIMU
MILHDSIQVVWVDSATGCIICLSLRTHWVFGKIKKKHCKTCGNLAQKTMIFFWLIKRSNGAMLHNNMES